MLTPLLSSCVIVIIVYHRRREINENTPSRQTWANFLGEGHQDADFYLNTDFIGSSIE